MGAEVIEKKRWRVNADATLVTAAAVSGVEGLSFGLERAKL
jgi:hypothetical protein